MSSAVTRPPICRWPTPFWYHHGGPASGSARKEGRPVTSAAIYARVSSARQKKDQTIGSQTAALRDHARQLGVELPEDWVFEDEGHSGATLVRPALEALRDLAAQGCVDVVLCYSPDRLARKFAYQALLIEEFARAGVRVEFVRGPRGDSPEDQLMVQFQGMFAEYEKAQLMERYRRGKAYRARTGSVNVLSGAPFGYRYVRKSDHAGASYEIIGHEAALVAEMFRRYADDGASIADLARWLTGQGAPTRTGKNRWDRSVVWAMLRNPAYAGTAVFGKTMATSGTPGLNRVARLQGRATPRAARTVDQPREEWLEIPVPAIVDQDHITGRLADPALIRAEISKRLDTARTSDPVTRQRQRLEIELARATASITAMIEAFSEQLLTIDELRDRMPHLRAREASLRGQIDALDAQAADRDAYLKLADDLEGFLTQLNGTAATAAVEERQRVLRLLVKDVLIGPEKITIRHRIPVRGSSPGGRQHEPDADTEGDHRPGYLLRWGRDDPALGRPCSCLFPVPEFREDPGFQERLYQRAGTLILDPHPEAVHQCRMINFVETGFDVGLEYPPVIGGLRCQVMDVGDRVMCAPVRPEPIRARLEIRLEDGLEHQFQACLDYAIGDGRNTQFPEFPCAT